MWGLGSLLLWCLLAPLRRPSLLMAGSLLFVGAAITTNALFLQTRPHPAPLVITRTPLAEPQPQAPAPRTDDLVLAIQSALRRVGYYSGPLDGLTGPQTQAAIEAFEAAAGLPQKGEASLDLLRAVKAAKAEDASSLEHLAAGTQEQPQTDVQSDDRPDDRVAAVQHALAISAYGPLREDGVLGPETREAIVRFQRDRGLPQTGEVTDALIVHLRAAGALQEQ